MRVAAAWALAMVSAACRSAAALIFCASACAFVLRLADEHLPLGFHAVEHRLRDAFGQADFFEAEKFDLDAVIVGLQFGLHGLFDFVFNLRRISAAFGSAFTKSDSGCLPTTALLALRSMLSSWLWRGAHGAVAGNCCRNAAGVGNLPADIDAA